MTEFSQGLTDHQTWKDGDIATVLTNLTEILRRITSNSRKLRAAIESGATDEVIAVLAAERQDLIRLIAEPYPSDDEYEQIQDQVGEDYTFERDRADDQG